MWHPQDIYYTEIFYSRAKKKSNTRALSYIGCNIDTLPFIAERAEEWTSVAPAVVFLADDSEGPGVCAEERAKERYKNSEEIRALHCEWGSQEYDCKQKYSGVIFIEPIVFHICRLICSVTL